MSTKTLVILGSSLTALAVARDAHAHGLEPVIVDCAHGVACDSRYVRVELVPDRSATAAMASVLKHAGPRSALLATSDDWLHFVAAGRSMLSEAFATVLHPSPEMLDTFLCKSDFMSWCERNGLPTPRSWCPANGPMPESLGFPLLLRPVRTLRSRPELGLPKAVEVRSPAELYEWNDRFERAGVHTVATESLLGRPLRQYSVSFARQGRFMMSMVAEKRRPAPEYCAQGTYVEVCEAPQIEALGRAVAERSDYFGIGEVEIIHSEHTGQSHVIEINARPWLQYPLAMATGRDYLGLMLGTTDLPFTRTGRVRHPIWLNFRNDRVVRNGWSWPAYLRSLLDVNVFAVYDRHDLKPLGRMAVETAARAAVLLPRLARHRSRSQKPAEPSRPTTASPPV